MTPQTAQLEETILKIQHIIMEVTGEELENITPDSELVDLNLYGVDLKRVVVAIGKAFSVYLYTEDIEEECETILDMALLVHEEAHLG
jgi:acyl carrier protein